MELLAATAEIVQGLHEQGVLRRDLKPSNILVDDRGAPHVVDLGLARVAHASAMTLTSEGAPVGTPAYLSPEQARGDRQALSTRTDVFALGAVAFALLTGEPPREEEESLSRAIHVAATEPLRDPRQAREDLPSGLTAIVQKATRLAPDGRYASAGELADDLHRWLRGEPVTARPPSAWMRLTRWAARRPLATTVTLASLMGVSIFALSALSVWWWNLKPADLHIVPNRIMLVSRGGNVLHSWVSEPRGRQTQAAAIWHNGDLHVAIGHGNQTNGPYATRVALYSASDPEQPLWSYLPEVPNELRPAAWPISEGETMRCAQVYTFDVLSERPGEEIVAIFWHYPWSPSAITVLSRSGEVLREYWHDGHLWSLRFDTTRGLLFLAGSNSEYRFSQRETGFVGESRHLNVAFALDPRSESGVIAAPGGMGTLEPVWYQTLRPISLQLAASPPPLRDAITFATATIVVQDLPYLEMHFEDEVSASWRFDGDGVHELTRVARAGEEGVDPLGLKQATWGPLPPPTPEALAEETQHRIKVWREIHAHHLIERATAEGAGTPPPPLPAERSR